MKHRNNWDNVFDAFIKVIVDFEVEIYEPWTDDLEDPESDDFQELADKYIAAFNSTFAQSNTDEVESLTSIEFATIYVTSFTREDDTENSNLIRSVRNYTYL